MHVSDVNNKSKSIVQLILKDIFACKGFGVNPEIPTYIGLNNASVILSIVSTVMILFIDVERIKYNREEKVKLLYDKTQPTSSYNTQPIENLHNNETFLDLSFWNNFDNNVKHFVGISSSILSGIAFGFTNTPILYEMDNYYSSSKDMADYTYSLSCGILLSSLVYFIVYCIVMKNNPVINKEIFFPSLCTGIFDFQNSINFFSKVF